MEMFEPPELWIKEAQFYSSHAELNCVNGWLSSPVTSCGCINTHKVYFFVDQPLYGWFSTSSQFNLLRSALSIQKQSGPVPSSFPAVIPPIRLQNTSSLHGFDMNTVSIYGLLPQGQVSSGQKMSVIVVYWLVKYGIPRIDDDHPEYIRIYVYI
jgi:hypothetical protein